MWVGFHSPPSVFSHEYIVGDIGSNRGSVSRRQIWRHADSPAGPASLSISLLRAGPAAIHALPSCRPGETLRRRLHCRPQRRFSFRRADSPAAPASCSCSPPSRDPCESLLFSPSHHLGELAPADAGCVLGLGLYIHCKRLRRRRRQRARPWGYYAQSSSAWQRAVPPSPSLPLRPPRLAAVSIHFSRSPMASSPQPFARYQSEAILFLSS